MSFNIDELLQQPMTKIPDNGFSQKTLNKILAKQKRYQRAKVSMLFIVSAVCALVVSLINFDFTMSLNFNSISQLQDLSNLFIGESAMFALMSLALVAITYFSLEALEPS